MALATEGSGPFAAARGFASQVHPVFMTPPLAASAFGALVAGVADPNALLVHAVAIFFAVYTAHVKDGFVDYYRRGEDDSHPLTVWGCRLALVGAATAFSLCLAYLGYRVGVGAVLVTLPTFLLGYLHAPQLDTNPVTVTMGYPLGIALSILGGYYVQTASLSVRAVSFAVVFLFVITGVKIIDDIQDYEYDRSIDKHTVAVVLGRRDAVTLAYYTIFLGLLSSLWLTVDGTFPPFAFLATVAFGAVALSARGSGPRIATMLLIRGSYVFLAALIVAVAFEPIAGVPLPDVGVFGAYTYLLTELAFGTIAFALLYRADALAAYVRSMVVIYPIAYVWDWYTLEVGVFEIPLRTGWVLFDIPVEEHLFILVVPALVIGLYESVRDGPGSESTGDDENWAE